MTERALMVRVATSPGGRYFAVGIEVPKVRIFDTMRGNLVGVAEPAAGSMLQKTASKGTGLSITGLTCVAFAPAPRASKGSAPNSAQQQQQQQQQHGPDSAGLWLLVGCTDGTLLVHDVEHDRLIHHVSVSDTQQPVSAVACVGGFIFACTAQRTLAVVDAATGTVVLDNLPIVRACTAIAVAAVSEAATGTFHLLCCGTQSVLYRVHVASHSSGNKMEKLSTAPGHTQVVTVAQLCEHDPFVAITASASEGVVRVWDMAPESTRGDRCRRVLAAGNRIMQVSLRTNGNSEAGSRGSGGGMPAMVVVTTVAGTVLVWRLLDLLPRLADTLPLRATIGLTSEVPHGRLLAAESTSMTSLMVVRGRYATPRFEGKTLSSSVAVAAAGRAGEAPLEKLPFHAQLARAGVQSGARVGYTDDSDAFDPLDTWASHEAMSSLALATNSAEFAPPLVHRERDMKTLAKVIAPTASKSATVAGASIPLHQALHADDTAMVLELLHLAAATETAMVQLIEAMLLPYLLKLVKILSDRVVSLGARHPLHKWLHVILRCRGAELYEHERKRCLEEKKKKNEQEQTNGSADGLAASDRTLPSTFLAPIMHHYRAIAELRDPLAHLHGRMSIFHAVRPHNTTTTGAKQVAFPNEFVDVNANDPESWKIVRVKRRAGDAVETRRRRRRRNMLPDGGVGADGEDEDDVPQTLMRDLGDEGGNSGSSGSDGGTNASEEDDEGEEEEGGSDMSDPDDVDLDNIDLDSSDDASDGEGGGTSIRRGRRQHATEGDDDEADAAEGDYPAADVESESDGEVDNDADAIVEDDTVGADAEALMALDDDDPSAFARLADRKRKKHSRLRLD